MNDIDMLNYALENGIIDENTIRMQIEMNERKKYLNGHEFRIWQGKNMKWYTYLPNEEGERVLVKRNSKESIEDRIVEFYKDREQKHYFKDCFYEWINDKLKYGEIQMQTYCRYESDYMRYISGSRIEHMEMRFITEIALEQFIKSTIHEKNLKRKAWSNLRTLIRGTFKYAKRMSYTSISITQFLGDLELSNKIFTASVVTDEESVFKQSEVDKIVNYINSHDDRITDLAILLAFQTGMRVGEIVALKYSDIDINGGYINVDKTEIRYKDIDGIYRREIRDNAKTEAGNRKVIISQDAINTIKRIRKINPFGEYVFMHEGHLVRGNSLTKRLKNICEYVKITPRSMHKIRKTYATKLINNNVDEKIIMRQMGHTDIATTKQYYYFNDKSEDDARLQIVNALGK